MCAKYTGNEVNRAGEALRSTSPLSDEEFKQVFDVLSYWRFSHDEPLEVAFQILQEVVSSRDRSAFFAKRLKRHVSIYNKLCRFQKMNLKNMQDVGGCRAVVTSDKKLRQSVRDLKKYSQFKFSDGPKFRYKDYLRNPKADGYRSYHMVGKFSGSENRSRSIEIQIRTRIQHYWATALEIVDLFTNQALKSNQGDMYWTAYFVEISKQFGAIDGIHLVDSLSREERLTKYSDLLRKDDALRESCILVRKQANELGVVRKLEAFASSLNIVGGRLSETDSSNYALLKIDSSTSTLFSMIFTKEQAKEAELEYKEAEKEAAQGTDLAVALVSASAVGGIQVAYPNFFADSSEFLELADMISSVRF